VPALLVNLHHASSDVRARAVQLLTAKSGETISKELLGALADKSTAVRKEAVIALGKRKEKDAIPALLPLAKDVDLRFDALRALTRMPDPRAAAVFLDGLGSKNQKQRDESLRALTSIKKEAFPVIEGRLQKKPALAASVVLQLQKIYKDVPEAKASALFNIAAKEVNVDEFAAAAVNEQGNPTHGRAMFLDLKGVACAKCHRVGKEGGEVGPDLSGIGLKYNRNQLIESVLYPSKQILDGYDVTILETKAGQVLTGIVRAEADGAVTLIDAEGKKHTVKTADVESRAKSAKSIMPDGLQNGLTIAEFADIISFLETLKEAPPTAAAPQKK
jgi:putative heme-binding domain-containing protein